MGTSTSKNKSQNPPNTINTIHTIDTSEIDANQSETIKKANVFIAEAQRKLKEPQFMNSNKYEQAADLFVKAGNLLKVENEFGRAAEIFYKAYDCQKKQDYQYNTIQTFIQCAICHKKNNNITKAIECYDIIVEQYILSGEFRNAAKYQQEVADMYTSIEDMINALKYYRKASSNYAIQDSSHEFNTCQAKIAFILCESKNYEEAMNIYEQLAKTHVDNNLLRYKAKDYLFYASLCSFIVGECDTITVQKSLTKYKEMSGLFESSPQFEFLMHLYEAIETLDIGLFVELTKQYDSRCTLDKLQIDLLLAIKNKLSCNVLDGENNGNVCNGESNGESNGVSDDRVSNNGVL